MEVTFTDQYPPRYQKLEEEAYARVMWGDNPHDALKFLLDSGVKLQLAQNIVGNAIKERRAEIRKSGLKHLLIGVSIIILTIIGFIVTALINKYFARRLYTPCFVIICFGCLRICKGIARLLTAREHGAISDID